MKLLLLKTTVVNDSQIPRESVIELPEKQAKRLLAEMPDRFQVVPPNLTPDPFPEGKGSESEEA